MRLTDRWSWWLVMWNGMREGEGVVEKRRRKWWPKGAEAQARAKVQRQDASVCPAGGGVRRAFGRRAAGGCDWNDKNSRG